MTIRRRPETIKIIKSFCEGARVSLDGFHEKNHFCFKGPKAKNSLSRYCYYFAPVNFFKKGVKSN
jgi:hypothetical protein